MKNEIQKKLTPLREYLELRGVDDPKTLLALLGRVWPEMSGADDHAMAAYKLSRIESPLWEPPCLTFTIERHGGTVRGSKRAELQTWRVNLDEGTAAVVGSGVRQLAPNSPRLNVQALAREIAHAVSEQPDDPRLRWFEDGKVVHPVLARIIPDVGPKQTVQGRRRRLSAALREAMAEVGWQPTTTAGRFEKYAAARED